MQKFNFLNKEKKIKRVLILGPSGIISKNFQMILKKEKIPFLAVGRKKINNSLSGF